MDTTLGIDLGTQSLKVVFYDFNSREIVATASSPLDVIRDENGKAEQDANWWLAALQQSLQEINEDIRMSVRAIAVSGQQHGFVPINNNGEVLHTVKLWCDTETQQECDEACTYLKTFSVLGFDTENVAYIDGSGSYLSDACLTV